MNQIPGQHDGNITPAPDDLKRLIELRSGLVSLVSNITRSQHEIERTPEPLMQWPEIFNYIVMINRALGKLHKTFEETSDELDDEGNPHSKGDILAQLRVFPTPPFQADAQLGFLDTTLRITPNYEEIAWEDERLRAASEFCRIDPRLDVGASSKAEDDATKKKKKSRADDAEEGPRLERVKVDMRDEDDYPILWAKAAAYGHNSRRLMCLALDRPFNEDSYTLDDDDDTIAAIQEQLGVADGLSPAAAVSSAPPQAAPLPLGALLRFMSTGAPDGRA